MKPQTTIVLPAEGDAQIYLRPSAARNTNTVSP